MKKTVVVVGAGPGGAAAAVRLAQRGVRNVLLLDKDQFPREKTCGSALSPNGVKLIEELGIGAEVRERGYVIRSLVIKTPGGREMKLTTDQAAIILLRKHFDNLLVEQAKKLGVEFRGGFKVTELVREGDRIVGVRGKDGEVRADLVLGADGAHSIFSDDPRPKRTISTLMGWWEDFDFEPNTIEMVFDKNLSPLYGWMFPEGVNRINIGICMDGEEDSADAREHDGRKKTTRNVRDVFNQFLADHYGDRLRTAKQIGKFKGHPISYTTWIRNLTRPGFAYLGEGGRMTHNATGEGIFHAMQSGVYAADAAADVVQGVAEEKRAWSRYEWACRRRFTMGFVMGHVLRGALKTPAFDWIATAYNDPRVRNLATWALGSALAGSHVEVAREASAIVTTPPVNGKRASA
jgi:geranylgeranyl reductase family protein